VTDFKKEVAMLSHQMLFAEIYIKGFAEQARGVSLEKNVDHNSIITKGHQRIFELLIVRLGDLLIVTGQRLKMQAQALS
jgi:hypothetical protein